MLEIYVVAKRDEELFTTLLEITNKMKIDKIFISFDLKLLNIKKGDNLPSKIRSLERKNSNDVSGFKSLHN